MVESCELHVEDMELTLLLMPVRVFHLPDVLEKCMVPELWLYPHNEKVGSPENWETEWPSTNHEAIQKPYVITCRAL